MVAVHRVAENQAVMKVRRSKRLPQSDEVLSSFDSRRRVQVVTDIDSHRPHRSCVTYAEPERIRVLAVEADGAEHVAAIVESHNAQALLDRHGYSEFRVEDEQLIPASWHVNGRAGTRIIRITAGRNRALWTGSVQRKAA